MQPGSAPDPRVGTVLGSRYELTRHIARGGMGDVYAARDQVLERAVAVKVFRAVQPTDRTRFDAEIHLLAGLSHPGLVQVYDAGSTDDDAFLVLELIDGPPLRAAMQGTPLDPHRVAAIGAQIAEALDHIHSAGVVHRDVTPSNVLCGPDGRAKIVDFGIARLMDTPRVTAPQSTVGTAAYMSPEQVQGHEVTPASDVYSLGLVLLEALTGQKAFPGTAMESAVARLVRTPDTRTGVPRRWQPLLDRMTATEPTQRPSAAEVHTRLLDLTPSGTSTAPAPTVAAIAQPPRRVGRARVPRRARRPIVAVAAAAVLSVVSVVALSAAGDPNDGIPPASGDETTTSTSATVDAQAVAGTTGADRSADRPAENDSTEDAPASTTTTAAAGGSSGTRPGTSPPTSTAPPTTAAPTTTTLPPTTTTAPSPTTTAVPTTVAP